MLISLTNMKRPRIYETMGWIKKLRYTLLLIIFILFSY